MEHLFVDPTMFGVMKIVGGAILFALGVPFIIGIVLGWMVGRAV